MVATATRQRELLTAGDPDELYPVPSEESFGKLDFIEAKDLQPVLEAVIFRKRPDLDGAVIIDILWKRKGGTSNGKWVLGKLTKVSGLNRYYSRGADFVIWIAADAAEGYSLTRYQVEACIYHELCHIEVIKADDGDPDHPPTYKKGGHDFEGFLSELEEYGPWQHELKAAVSKAQKLPGFED